MTNKMQIFGLFICTQSAVRVSGEIFARHQEHLTVFTASDIVHLRMLLPAGVMDEVEREYHLIHYTGRQQHGWTTLEAVKKVNCS